MKRLVILLALCLVPFCLAEDAWNVSFKNGFISVRYKGKELFASIDLAAFTPDYKACPFTMRKGSYRQEAGRHVFHHSTEDAEATLTISFTESEMTLDMNAKVKQMMPFEYGLRFKPDTFALEDGSIYILNNGRSSKIINDEIESFKPDGLSFETEKASHSFLCEGNMNFTFQDRRKIGGFCRLVGTRRLDNSKNGNVIKQHIVWKIKEYNDEQAAFRKKHVLAHANRTTNKLSVPNADFEQGETEWECGPNASFESVDAKHGKSAKMIVSNPMKDPVYITRLVPIVPGGRYLARCQIKTKDVEMAEGKMSSVGACLIVEWADENRKWIAPGVYSKGLWGTNNWTMVECKKLRAPLNAHYASVFIALRGKGTAWYDDFELCQQEESAVKTAPTEGEILHTNAPLFSWLRLDGVEDYTLRLSQSPSFPPEETIQQAIDVVTTCQLRFPLKPGVWYWRVSAPGFEDKNTASFVVDVPQGVNLVPPQIVAQHSRLLSPTDTYSFSIRHTDGITEVKAVDADEPSAQFAISSKGKNEYTVVPQKGWRKGLNTIEITATETNKASETKRIWIVCAPKPETTIVIDKEGRYTENGRHIFPLGIYEVKPEYMADVKAAGFDVVHTYTWEGSQDEEAAKAYMDAAQAAGLRVFIGFDRGNHSKNGIVQGNFELLARRVGSLAVHPALFCWYLFDEPEVPSYYVPPKQLTAFAELLRKLDPYHPVVMTTWGKSMNDYRKTWDTHWSQSYSKPAEIVKLLAEHREYLHNDSPITLLIHCYDRKQSKLRKLKQPVDWDKFEPDYDWMRAAAMVGITKGVNGLWWWWYAKHVNDWMTAAHNPVTWGNLCKVVEEVRSLRPVLNADGQTQGGTVVVGNAKIEWWAKRVDGKDTVIIVNTGETSVEATIEPKGIAPIPVKLGRFGVIIR